MKLSFDKGVYICTCAFDERQIPKQAGFLWDQDKKRWYTLDVRAAARLRTYGDESVKVKLIPLFLKITPWTGEYPTPSNLALREFQKEAVTFALSRNHSYLGLDPGLGKGVIAVIIQNILQAPLVYICPPFLTRNVEEEFRKWLTDCSYFPLIIPDSMLYKEKTLSLIKNYVESYPTQKPVLIVDEAHRYKSMTAKRTLAFFKKIKPLFSKTVMMSGTPMPNRPIELYPVLSQCAPETIDFMNFYEFGEHYGGMEQPDPRFPNPYRGASNVEELAQKIMGKYMLRMRKAEVLTELPPKTEEMIFIGDNLPPEFAALERNVLRKGSPEDLVKMEIAHSINPNFEIELAIATYRRELGNLKVKTSSLFLESLLSEGQESILVFAIHKDTIASLAKELESFSPLVITGATPMSDRHDMVKTFQEDKSKRLMIGNIQAMGVGFTLTKATRVVFVEFSWVPGENDQASDRAHRIGQKDNVFCQFLVYRNSIDRMVLETLFKKKKAMEYI